MRDKALIVLSVQACVRVARLLIRLSVPHIHAPAMNDQKLIRKLALVIVVKLALLTALWWHFVRDHDRVLEADSVAVHIGARPQPTTEGTSHGQ